MTPRARRRLLVAVLVLALPLMLAVVLVWFLASGGVQRQIQQHWAQHYPGTLHIGALELQGVDHIQLRDLRWQYQGQDLAGAAVIDIEGSLLRGSLRRLRVAAPFVHVDADSLPAWEQMAQRLGHDMSQRDEETPLSLLFEQGLLAVDSYELRDLQVTWQGEGVDGQLHMAAETPAGSWQARVALVDGAVQVEIAQLPIDVPALYRALALIQPDLLAQVPAAQHLPPQVELAGSSARWRGAEDGEIDLHLASAEPWQGLHALELQASGSWPTRQVSGQLAIAHRHGRSQLSFSHHQDGLQLTVADDASALPLDMVAEHAWPAAWPALPPALGLAQTQLQRSPQGVWSGELHAHLAEPWLGLRRLRAHDLHLPESVALAAGASQHWSAGLSLDAGFGDALRLRLQHHRQRSAHTAAQQQRWQLHFDQGPVRRDTLLAVPRALDLMQGWRPWTRLLIPSHIDLGGTQLQLAMPDVQGQLRLDWQQGHLHADIDSSLIDWRIAPLSFEHAAVGRIKGAFFANEAILRGQWQELYLRQGILPEVAALLGWDPRPLKILAQIVQQMPSGEGRLFRGRFPADSMLRMQGADDRQLALTVNGQGASQLRGQGLDLAMLNPVDARWQWQGQVESLQAQWPAQHGLRGWPSQLRLQAQGVDARRDGWHLAARQIVAQASMHPGQALPLAASLELSDLHGHGAQQEWQPISAALQLQQDGHRPQWDLQLDLENWMQASAQLQGEDWPQGADARASVALEYLDLAQLPLLGLAGGLQGSAQLQAQDSGWTVAAGTGELDDASLKPWLQGVSGPWQLSGGWQAGAPELRWHLQPQQGTMHWQQLTHSLQESDHLVLALDPRQWRLEAALHGVSRRHLARSTSSDLPRDLGWWWWQLSAPAQPQHVQVGLLAEPSDGQAPQLPLSAQARTTVLPLQPDISDENTEE